MPKTIWKFRLHLGAGDVESVVMPSGVRILCVQLLEGTPCVWALVDPSKAGEARKMWIVGTGYDVPDGDYVGTFQLQRDALACHMFASRSIDHA